MAHVRAASTVVLLVVLAGCTSPPIACERDGDCPAELACGGDGLCGSGPVTRLFVISRLAIPGTDGTHARGFDLDGVVSDGTGTGCVERARDYVSLDDPAVSGVDNWMATVLPTIATNICAEGAPHEPCVEELIASSIAEGSTLIAIELGDLDSYRDDAEVDVVFHRARIPGCSASCAPELDGGALAADQRYVLEHVAEGSGAIDDGVLRASFEGPLPIEMRLELPLVLILRDGRLEAGVDAAGLHDAVVGGGYAFDDIPYPICDPGPCDPSTHPLALQADLDPDPADPTTCRRLSVALTFSAVPALER